ncbi:MAG TPA: DUF92 domain-containing protein [Candidatus Kapabacteria bacterium]|jgi:uncharacterized protein (TIGR00297 family)|nr:DUF92 domain-containing protein [Candidatus Kapabacteria bacterium]
MTNDLLLGLVFSLAIAVLAWRLRALDISGAIGAVIVGTIIFGIGGLTASIALVAFFISGSILSALPLDSKRREKKKMAGDTIGLGTLQMGVGRNWKQVVANGGLPALGIAIARFIPGLQTAALYFYFGAIAASAADSWATEIGIRYGSNVRDILTWRPAQGGVSGGISTMGMLASLAGAGFIALTLFIPFKGAAPPRVFVGVVMCGFLGSVVDSILGSSLQAVYWCEDCQCLVEKPIHCSRPAILRKGYKLITNNVVNFISSAISGLFLIVLLDFTK